MSIDDGGEYIGSCCQEGFVSEFFVCFHLCIRWWFQVKISGLFTKNDDQLITFPRPVRAVCLDPNFSKTKMFVTGDTNVSRMVFFGRMTQLLLLADLERTGINTSTAEKDHSSRITRRTYSHTPMERFLDCLCERPGRIRFSLVIGIFSIRLIQGVGVYDLHARRIVGLVETDGDKE